jgi:hypothetical protein
MKGSTVQVRILGGMQQTLPQEIEHATLIENMTLDEDTQAFSSRVGYERYRPDPADQFNPFSALGRIDSVYVLQQLPGGARQSLLIESGNTLYLYLETGQENVLVGLASRTSPAATDTPSVFTQFQDRVIVTNGLDAPLIIRPWPLAASTDITSAMKDAMVRPLGFYGPPAAPDVLKVATLEATTTAINSAASFTGSTTTNWYPVRPNAIAYPNLFGIGPSSENNDNRVRFRVSLISDTGSESPLSDEGIATWRIETNNSGFRYAPSMRLPIGPRGTVARRVYRTQNQGLSFAFVDDVRNNAEQLYHIGVSKTGASAPNDLASVPFPAANARVCAVFKDCVFLDGGRDQSSTLFFSNPGRPDQYGGVDYITLDGGGGEVTGLYAYNNNLIVFRSSGIDVLTGSYPSFTVQTVTSQVACRAPNSIDSIPGIGVAFLAEDGVYALQGGLDGGAQFRVVPLGVGIRKELGRMTLECSPRAVGRYSPLERAYHLYVPVDGNDRPNLGFVFHLDKQAWSLRTGFPVGAIDRLHNGTLVFGHNTGAEAAGSNPPAGLFVLSGARSMGGTIVADNYVPGPAPVSVYESCWHDMGDAQVKKQVQYVTLWCQTRGNITIDFRYYKDFETEELAADNRFIYQPPDRANQPVLNSAVVGADKWQDSRLVPIRLPTAVQSCSWFKFRIDTTDDILLVGYEVEYATRGSVVIEGKQR